MNKLDFLIYFFLSCILLESTVYVLYLFNTLKHDYHYLIINFFILIYIIIATYYFLIKTKEKQRIDYVDCIENGITDYCLNHEISPKDIPFSVFELSIHINDYISTKKEKLGEKNE